jgi:hypothetical protein
MVALGVACTVATFYESAHGTPAAQRAFYGTWWFALILGLLGLNIFTSMMKRYPWRSQHAGFVIAHVGILALLVGSLVSLHFGLDSNMALYEGETSDRVSLAGKALSVVLPGHSAHGTFPVDFEMHPPAGGEGRFALEGSGVTLVAEEFLPHADVHESFVAGESGSPAIHVILKSAFANQEAWLAADEEHSHLDLGPLALSFHAGATPAAAKEALGHGAGRNELSLVFGPRGNLVYNVSTTRGPAGTGPVVVGRAIETPWMGMTVTVDRLLPKSATVRDVHPAPLPVKDERRVSAVKVRLEGPSGRSPSQWLLFSESRSLSFAGGDARVAYRTLESTVPFRVTLLKFNSEKYPGSNMAATYESWVRVEDPERGTSEHHISMNNPLHYRGYIFFQASYVEGEPMMSIFSVSRAPGLPLVYLGVTLIAAGVTWMFYLKPYLARRQGRRAEARRQAAGAGFRSQPVRELDAQA